MLLSVAIALFYFSAGFIIINEFYKAEYIDRYDTPVDNLE